MNAEEKLLKIIGHYGINHQLKKLSEEVYELQEAVLTAEIENTIPDLSKYLIENVTEEIADVMVLLEQFKLYYEIPEKEVIRIKWEKVERQLERIENE